MDRGNPFRLPDLYVPSIYFTFRSQKFQIMIARKSGQNESPESQAKLG